MSRRNVTMPFCNLKIELKITFDSTKKASSYLNRGLFVHLKKAKNRQVSLILKNIPFEKCFSASEWMFL